MNPGQCGLFFERLGVITMSTDKVSVHGSWASRWVFIFAATGSAVGLGSIWKFPYMVGVYGGGAFVLMFLACIALIGAPVMLALAMAFSADPITPTAISATTAYEPLMR